MIVRRIDNRIRRTDGRSGAADGPTDGRKAEPTDESVDRPACLPTEAAFFDKFPFDYVEPQNRNATASASCINRNCWPQWPRWPQWPHIKSGMTAAVPFLLFPVETRPAQRSDTPLCAYFNATSYCSVITYSRARL